MQVHCPVVFFFLVSEQDYVQYMLVNIRMHSTADKGVEHHCRSELLANQHGRYDHCVLSR